MALDSWFGLRPRSDRAAVHAAYHRLVEQARDPVFFRDLGVPDTLDGRFEVLSLHMFLLLNRLKGDSAEATAFAQALFNTFFADMDRSLREMGAGDLGVGRRVKAMAQGFYGRIAAYEGGLAAGDPELSRALQRNLYGTVSPVDPHFLAGMTRYLRRQQSALRHAPVSELLRGEVKFLPAAQALDDEGAA
jgi:cytochrome b pre-mRNA-processing protein 3